MKGRTPVAAISGCCQLLKLNPAILVQQPDEAKNAVADQLLFSDLIQGL